MARRKSTPQPIPCPSCVQSGLPAGNSAAGGTCGTCGGTGQLPGEFPFTYHYPINLTVTQPGTYPGTQPSLSIIGGTPNPYQTGTNPATLQLGSENPFKWMFNLLSVSSPQVVGDASRFLALALFDVGSSNWPFQSSPIMANLFAGDAKNPWPQLEPLTFGQLTNLQLIGYPVNYVGIVQIIGVATGGEATYTGTLNPPVLPGSCVVLDSPGGATQTDNGNGAFAAKTGVTGGTINYQTGAISFTFSADPTATHQITVTYTQGCALINAQFDLQGFYLKALTQDTAQSAAQSGIL